MASDNGVSAKILETLKSDFTSDQKNLLAQNICIKHDPLDVCLNRCVGYNHVYNCKVNPEGKPMTNQKSSGRCWIFAVLNAIRQQFVQSKKLDNFEFSQTHLFFWDKIERASYLLNVFEEVAKTEPESDSRTMMFLMSDPSCDGGQWDMLVNLITKHGLMPKSAWPDTHSSGSSRRMNAMINTKMRSFGKRIADLVKEGVTQEEMENAKQKMLSEVRLRSYIQHSSVFILRCLNTTLVPEVFSSNFIAVKQIYSIVSICLGTPPDTFQWEYYDSAKKYCKVEETTPLEFYEKHIKPIYNIEDKVCLVNDPRPNNGYNKLYSVKYLGNMTGKKTVYLNQPIEILKYLTVASIKSNEIVWFGCDVGKHFERKQGLLSLDIHDYQLTFNISMPALNKADRLLFGESLMTHAMAISGVSTDEPEEKDEDTKKQEQTQEPETSAETKTEEDKQEPEKPDVKVVVLHPVKTTKWRVENSWGDDKGDKGYLMMTDEWFSEFVYEVVVDKKFVPEEILKVLEQEPVVLPPWDPMGALACRDCKGLVE